MNKTQPPVMLVNPPVTEEQKNGPVGPVIKNLYFNSPPLGISYIAAVLEQHDFKALIIDATVEDLSADDTVAKIKSEGADIVGIASTTNFFRNAVALAEKIKKHCSDITIVIGGPHVTANADSTMKYECFDVACIGEGELTMLELVRSIRNNGNLESITGIAFRKDGKLFKTPPRSLIEDLDTIPFPARHLLPISKYIPQPNDGPYLPKTAMISSRGCPYRCIFCDHGVHGTTYRSFSPKRIVDEMEHLVNEYGINDIAFVDSLSMVSSKRMLDLSEEILSRKLMVHWTGTIRANIATPEVMQKMKAAGCWRVRVGIEAGNEDVLKFIGKSVTKDEIRRVVKEADDLGLMPKGFFIIGHLSETKETIEESIEFAKSLPLTDITVQINTPLPGTPQWKMISEYGTLITEDPGDYSFWEPVFTPNGMTESELKELHARFYREFYFRPSVIWRHLKMIRHWSDCTRYARALSLMIKMFVKKR